VALAVETGVPVREWLRDPVAMLTAAAILEDRAAELADKTR
jgi:hypothetical protein